MKKRCLFGLMVTILAAALAFTGCDMLAPDKDSDNGSGKTQESYGDLIIDGTAAGDKPVKVKFTTTRTPPKAVAILTPENGDKYEIQYDTTATVVSSGAISVTGTSPRQITFIPAAAGSSSFVAYLTNNTAANKAILNFPNNSIPGTTITGYKSEGSASVIALAFEKDLAETPFTLAVDAASASLLKVTLTASSGSGASYQWYRSESNGYAGTAISGATSDSYTPPTAAAGTLYYYVCVTNASGGFLRSKIATVEVKAGNSAGGDITNNLGAGGNLVDTATENKIIITGSVKVTGNSKVPVGKTLEIQAAGGELLVPAGITVTVSGTKTTLDVKGTLKVDGDVIVENGGILDVCADATIEALKNKKAASNSDGVLKGSGTITIKSGGKMYIPDANGGQFTLSEVTGAIEVEANGELFIVGVDPNHDKVRMEWPWIGTKQTKVTGNSEVLGADIIVEKDKIAIKPYMEGNNIALPYMILFGDATVLGVKDQTKRIPVNFISMFTVNPGKTLTIGDGTTIGSELTIGENAILFNNGGTVTVKANSKITATKSSAIMGTVIGIDGKPITGTSTTSGTSTTWTWENPSKP